MKKIFLFLFILIVFFSLSFSVLAAESITVPYLVENNHIFYTFSVIDLKQGNYNYVLSFPWPEVSFPGVLTLYSFDIPRSSIPSIFVPMLPPDVPFFPGFKTTISIFDKNTTNPFIVDFYVFSGVVGGQPITASWADFNSESSIYKNLDFILSFTPIQNPSFTDTVSFGISSVIFWIQSILISLFTGDLSPLASIAVLSISVSALLFAIYAIYKLIWGR